METGMMRVNRRIYGELFVVLYWNSGSRGGFVWFDVEMSDSMRRGDIDVGNGYVAVFMFLS